MKCALVLCLFSACLVKLTKGQDDDCLRTNCLNTYSTGLQAAGSDPWKLCRLSETLINCYLSTCHGEVPFTGVPALDQFIKDGNYNCDRYGSVGRSGSKGLSSSLLTVLGGLLLAACKIFHL